MAKNKLAITVDIEPVVKLFCSNTKCRHNLNKDGWLCCNFKLLEIDENGMCKSFEPETSDEKKENDG